MSGSDIASPPAQDWRTFSTCVEFLLAKNRKLLELVDADDDDRVRPENEFLEIEAHRRAGVLIDLLGNRVKVEPQVGLLAEPYCLKRVGFDAQDDESSVTAIGHSENCPDHGCRIRRGRSASRPLKLNPVCLMPLRQYDFQLLFRHVKNPSADGVVGSELSSFPHRKVNEMSRVRLVIDGAGNLAESLLDDRAGRGYRHLPMPAERQESEACQGGDDRS